MLDQRGRLLRAALGFAGCSLPSYDRALWALHTWLDSWPGIGHVAVGMHRQGFDLQLTSTTSAAGERRSTRPAWSIADERDRHRVGADAVARVAAGGWGALEQTDADR